MRKHVFLIHMICVFFFGHNYAGEKTIALNDSISIYLKEDTLYETAHALEPEKIVKLDNGIDVIDGKPVFGVDEDLPKTKLSKCTLSINGKKINLDVSYMYNPNLRMVDKDGIKIEIKNNIIKLNVYFSDGAGAYVVQWLIFGRESVRTVISENEYILNYIQ